MSEEIFQYMLSTLIPAVSQYSDLNPALKELASLEDLSLERLQLLESELHSINIPREIVEKINHLLWSRKVLSALDLEPFTAEASEIFIQNLAGLHQDLRDNLNFSYNLMAYLSCVMAAISDSGSIEEVCIYAQGLKFVKDELDFEAANSALDWAQVQIQTFLWEKLHDKTYDSLNFLIDILQQIDALYLEDCNRDIKELVISFAKLQIEENPEIRPEILGKIRNLAIQDIDLMNSIDLWNTNYDEFNHLYQPGVLGVSPPQRLIAETSEYYIQSKDEVVLDPRALYARGDSYPKVYIYRASLRSNPGLRVAVKEYVIDSEQKLKSYMKQEAEALKKCSGRCPACLKFYGTYLTVENSETVFGIVMELCNSSFMEEISRRNESSLKYTEEELIKITNSLLEGFSFLHRNNIFHRDIKPHNLLITDSGGIKIADFNISEVSNYSQITNAARTDLRFIQGTDGYMAPEMQAQFNRKLADRSAESSVHTNPAKTDVYGLGLTFLQMWTLESVQGLNLQENQGNLAEIISQIQHNWLKEMLAEMLTFDPNQRPAKIGSFIKFIPLAPTVKLND